MVVIHRRYTGKVGSLKTQSWFGLVSEGPCLDLIDRGLKPTVIVAVIQNVLERPNDHLEILGLPLDVVIRSIS